MKDEVRKRAPFGGPGRPRAVRLSSLVLLPVIACAAAASAQKRPKPALSVGDARRAIAEAPGVALRTGVVKVKEISPRGQSPARVAAEVTLGVRFARAADESAPQNAGLFRRKRWRAAEFRAGDGVWEDFDLLSEAAGPEKVEAARRALEELVTEFESRQAAGARGGAGSGADESAGGTEKAEPLTRGALRVASLSPLGSSAVAEVTVEAEFLLNKDSGGRWRVGEIVFGGVAGGDLAEVLARLDARKAERARAELEAVAEAHERYRRERGFYAAAADFAALMDHLNPLFIARVVRVDPWHNPYLYAGATGGHALSSAGPDGRPDTADDVRVSGGQ